MPRTITTRSAEIGQERRYSRSGPPSLRTSSSSEPDSLQHRSRLSDNRSPRVSQSDPAKQQQQQKKLGTRIANLESQLGQAQDELKCLKNHLASAESVKKKAQSQQLENKSKKQQQVLNVPEVIAMLEEGPGKKQGSVDEHETVPETDVFEVVPIEKVTLEQLKTESNETAKQGDLKDESFGLSKESLQTDDINLPRTKIEEKETELESFRQENEKLKTQINEKSEKISSAQSQVEELKLKLKQAEQELETIKTNTANTNEKLETTVKAKQDLENEMKMLRVQTEQWRKAADAAAYFLSGGGMETSAYGGGRRVSERCGSMDKGYYESPLELVVGSYSYMGSMRAPGLLDDESDDAFGGGKKKSPSSGIRMFRDLWKKKGRK